MKTLTSSNYHRVQYFLLKLRTRFLLTNLYKSYSWVIRKHKKICGFCTLVFYIFINNSRSKQNKRKVRGCNKFLDLTSELFLHISVAPFTQWFCYCWNDHFRSSWLYLHINRYICLEKLISIIPKRVHVE